MIEAVQAPNAAAQASAGPAQEYPTPTILPAGEAARAQRLWETDKLKDQSVVPEPVQPDPPAAQPQQNEDGAPVEVQPSAKPTTERQPDPEVPELPPIEPPRSWTKEAKQRFQSLPRETQQYLSVREQERDREVRRSQNQAAEARKALEAEREAAAQAKQQYEQALPRLLEIIEAANAGEFTDIKTSEDVERLAKQDPVRYARYATASKSWRSSRKRQ